MQPADRIGRRLKLRDLQILDAAAKAGSMAQAAVDLAITQPAVSYAIQEMEQALGVPLLERSSQGVRPTIYGEVLIDRSQVIFNELRQGINEIGSLADPSVGELRLGTTPPMSAIVSAILNRLVPTYPRLTFALTVGATDMLLRALRKRDVELVISRLADFVEDEDLDVDTLFHDELSVICSKRNKWARRRGVRLADLMDEPWVLPPTAGFLIHVMQKAFAAEGLEMPRATVTTQSSYALSVLVANGPFLAIHPSAMLTTPNVHPRLAAVDVPLRSTRGPIGLITLKGRSRSPIAKLFLQVGGEVLKSIRWAQRRMAPRRRARNVAT
jgi:DNA-binding transcriptional LysR family regulator